MKETLASATIVILVFICSYMTLRSLYATWNRSDCEEAGRRLRGAAELQVMPDGVRDVCIVTTEAGRVVVQMR